MTLPLHYLIIAQVDTGLIFGLSQRMSAPSKKLKFETAMEKLDKMIHALEEGDLPLEESLKTFEEGMELIRFCEEKLGEAEGKVEILTSNKNNLKEENHDD